MISAAERRGKAASPMNAVNEPICVLSAEDDADDRLLLSEAFAGCGFEVQLDFVPDGEALLNRLFQRRCLGNESESLPDILLLDLNMPKIDGRQALAAIRKNERLRDLAVAILTTSDDSRDVSEASRLGVDCYLVKPTQFEKLNSMMKDLVEHWIKFKELPSIKPVGGFGG